MKKQVLITIYFLLIVLGRAAGQCAQTGSLDQDVCSGASITNIVITESTSTTYSFTFTGTGLSASFDSHALTISGAPASSGTYMAKLIKDGTDLCTYTGTITVNSNPVAAITVNESSGTTPDDGIICPGASIVLTANGGTPAWNSGVTDGVSFVPTGTATYTATVQNSTGCTDTESITITVNSAPAAAISIIETSGSTDNDGTICQGAELTLTASGGTGYSWSPAITNGASFVPASSEDYVVTVTDANMCTATTMQGVTVNSNPTPVITINETSGLANNDGIVCSGASVILTASGGSTYLWSPVITNGSPFIPPSTSPYQVSVTDANGCKATISRNITVNANPVATISVAETSGSINNDGVICAGSGVVLTASGGTPAWDHGISNGISFVPVSTTTYSVIVTDAMGCTDSESRLVTVNPLPTPSITGISNLCVLSTQSYVTSEGKSDYLWEFPGGSKISGGGASDNSITINWLSPGSGKVRVNYRESGCYAAAPTELNVTINPKPTPAGVAVHFDAGELLKQFVTVDASYNYISATCPAEILSGTRITWYRADNNSGTNTQFITTKAGTDKTYTLSASDVGKYIQVRVEAWDGTTLSSPVSSIWDGPVQPNAVPEASNLSITGTPSVGNELTAHFDYTDAESDAAGIHIYKWYANGTEINKATSSTYIIVKADRGKVITFSIQPVALTGSSPGTIVHSTATPTVGDQPPVATGVSFSGVKRVGQVLTGNYTYSDNEGDLEGSSVYQWYSGPSSGASTAISGATSRTFILTNNQFNATTNYIAFSVAPRALDGTTNGSEVISSSQGPVINPAPTTTFPASPISGILNVNELLTGHYIYSDAEADLEGTSSVAWESSPNGTDSWIPAGTGISHLITEPEQGRYFRLKVTPRAATGTQDGVEYTSIASERVNTKPHIDGIGITGAASVGTELTGAYAFHDIDGDLLNTYNFSWLRDGVQIAGAISDKYTLTYDDEGHVITFSVVPIAQTGYLTGDPSTATTSMISDPEPGMPTASNICIEGTRLEGQTLRGKYTYSYHRPELNSLYQWYKDDSPISGANSIEYIVQAGDIDAKLTFKVKPRSSNIPARGSTWFESQAFPKITGLESQYGLNAADVTMSNNLGLAEGYFTGKGVSGSVFSPVNAGEGTWEVNYFRTYTTGTNSCSQRSPQSVMISADLRTFMPAMSPQYCSYDPPFTVTVTPEPTGASYISVNCLDMDGIPDMAGVHLDGDYSITIEPGKLRDGKHTLYYYYSIMTFIPFPLGRFIRFDYKIKQDFTIVKVRKDTRLIGLRDKYCKDSEEQIISVEGINALVGTGTWQWEGDPADGSVLTETATASSKLVPRNTVAGRKYIKYKYTLSGCESNPLRVQVDIYNSPDARFEIDDYYNIEGDEEALTPSVSSNTGGIFAGEGVSGNLLIPSLADEGPTDITYTYTDANLCTGTWTEHTTFRKAKGTITGISDIVCYDNINLSLVASGVPVNGTDGLVTYKGFTNKRNTLTTVPNTTAAVYSLPAIGEGEDVITFSYVWDGVDFSISKTVNIDNLGSVNIYNLEQNQQICDDVVPFELTVSKPGGVFTGLVTGENFDPKAAALDWVKYTYTNSKTGCSISTTVNVNVHKAPAVDFIPNDVCILDEKDTLMFMNKTISADPVVRWKWEFVDEGTVRMDSVMEAGYLYLKGGLQQVSLTAETDKGCIVRREKTFNIGRRPEADFYWKKDCYHPGESLQLFDATRYTTQPKSFSWKANGTQFGTSNNAVLPKTDTGYVKIEYIVRTDYYMCHDTVSKDIYIKPAIQVKTDGYFEDFEKGKAGWITGDNSAIWSFGVPSGTDIKSAASGKNAWFTADAKDGNSAIESPCFDLSAIKRPLIKIKVRKDLDKERDGAVLQYKIADENDWHPVGTIDDGIEWYNSATINGKPGGTSLGWTTAGAADENYRESIHTLDDLIGKRDVKFRLAYGSSGSYSDRDGISFDDIFIGERSRQVLVEHFMSYNNTESMNYKALVDTIVEHKEGDVINIQYHTNLSGIDSLYLHNPGEINARMLFYGLTRVPYTFVDGGNGNDRTFNKLYDYRSNPIDSNEITKRTLVNSKFRIFIDPVISGRVLTVKGYIKALENVSTNNLTLFIAITEKKNAGDFDGAPQNTHYINVFRKFIPDPAGIVLKSNWLTGDSISLAEKTWTIEKVLNQSDIEIIAFLQSTDSKEIYQAFSVVRPEIIVGIENPFGKEGAFTLYPNPASNFVTIGFAGPLKSESLIRIYSIRGDVIREYKVGAGSTRFTVEDPGLKGGIYLVRVTTGNFDVGYKKLIITED